MGIAFWILLNTSYTVAVFTDPGSPLSDRQGYTALPSHEPASSSITAKSSGEYRFCKKCQTRKPDRAHHCSSCKRCVLKMDHHCPWLATCVGFRNYKPFILFLGYTCAFCYICFAVSASWVWGQVLSGGDFDEEQRIMPVNYILLCVLAGIIGLVLSGFTGWHIYLATQGQTTIESLEKTRYLAPVRRSMQNQISRERNYVGADDAPQSPRLTDQIREFHANALPGVTRPEEGEDDRETSVSAHESLRRNYSDMEAQREHDRYAAYLDERDSERLPNAFDHGWKRNLRHVFGERPALWLLPICNTTGDGWSWETSARWREAREDLAKERQARERENRAFEQEERGWSQRAPVIDFRSGSGIGSIHNTRVAGSAPQSDVSMQSLPPRKSSRPSSAHSWSESSEDEDDENNESSKRGLLKPQVDHLSGVWNDVPDDMVSTRTPPRGTVRTRSPRPPRSYPKG